jgi:NADH dehydrogenase [ubiquinone] 1 alpha subcomplex assembly factor 7
MSLLPHLLATIKQTGPLSVASFMNLALSHPEYGYYMRRDPFGKDGDFITAPEISQMFGELIGIWAAHGWQTMGAPKETIVVELGPGRGTLMKDFLRGTKSVYGFHPAISVHMVETSPALQTIQQETLKHTKTTFAVNAIWHETIATLPKAPMLLIANEFFDALPIHQYVKTAEGWREKMVGITQDGEALQFVLSPDPSPMSKTLAARYPHAPLNAVIETSPVSEAIIRQIAEHIATYGGMALIIDYGYSRTSGVEHLKDTLQAVRKHAYHPVLQDLGNSDITAHVDFSAIEEEALTHGVACYGPVTQGHLLSQLGIELRAKALLNHANDVQQQAIVSAVKRLVSSDEMGTLFKALAIVDKKLGRPSGF